MKERWKEMPKIAVLKWAALFAIVFALSLPGTAQTAKAANNYTVTVASGYLALRNAQAYDTRNEIGKLYTGDTVDVTDASGSTYWTVYSAKLGKSGYVNRAYLTSAASARTVSVQSGYLALRNAKAYDSRNEVGKLYTGDTVQVANQQDATYWLVYAPGLNKGGYVNKNYLQGQAAAASSSGGNWTVSVQKGYLALRTAKAYDSRNEIGELYSGDTVQVQDSSDGTYWYVYSPKLGKSGYVNKNYLIGGGSAPAAAASYTVSVQSGYLALRNAKAYDSRNEIGQLYSGDTVQVQDSSDGTYWYVYSPKLGKSGYVNRNYLVGAGASAPAAVTKTVSVQKGYLALRNAKAYDTRNEIGQLYSGDTVQVQDSSDGTYWYVYSPKLGKSGYVNKDYLY